MPARGAFSFRLPAPRAKGERYLGVVRGPLKSPDTAIDAFRGALAHRLGEARKQGQLAHEIFIKIPMPGDTGPAELIGIDEWCDAEGMQAFTRT
jgi:hypothetical protein